MWTKLRTFSDIGLLIMRIGIGTSFAYIHGWPKFSGGVDSWTSLGERFVNLIGIDFIPVFWGFMAAASEFFGGILIVIGLLFRPACAFLLFTMFIAAVFHITAGDSLGTVSHSLKLFFVFAGLIFIGPGKFSIDKK